MDNIVICLGSNCGDRSRNVAEALAWLRDRLSDSVDSGIYETPAFGHAGSPYMNAVMAGRFAEDDVKLFEKECKEYEVAHGRDAEARRHNNVPIDIDIVKAGQHILRPADFACEFFQIGYRRLNLSI